MPRYFFHIRNGNLLFEDKQSTELPDLAAALRWAAFVSAGNALRAISLDKPWDSVVVEVWEETQFLEAMPLRQVITARESDRIATDSAAIPGGDFSARISNATSGKDGDFAYERKAIRLASASK